MTRARLALLAALVVVAELVDAAVLDRFTVAGTSPDLLVLVVVAAGLSAGGVHGALVGACAGLLADLTPPGAGLLGVNALAYAVAGAVSGRWYRSGGRTSDQPMLLALVAAGVAAVLMTAVRLLFALTGQDAQQVAVTCLAAAVTALALGVVVLPGIRALDRRAGEEPW